jgi:hypothetical protein
VRHERSRKEFAKKTQKRPVTVERKAPSVHDVHQAIVDSYALILVAFMILVTDAEEDHGYAIAVLHHGVNLLGQVLDGCDKENSRLYRQNSLAQEGAS